MTSAAEPREEESASLLEVVKGWLAQADDSQGFLCDAGIDDLDHAMPEALQYLHGLLGRDALTPS